jgi:protein-tyrosine phosphatase
MERSMGWIEARFGRRKGLARLGLSHVRSWIGQYGRFRAIEWARVERFVFVCLGNLCRSPYAEARGRALGVACASFGLSAGGGDPANLVGERTARKRGLDLSTHRSKSMDALRLGPSDLLVAMEPAQAERLLSLTRGTGAQVTLLGLWCWPSRAHLEDPYGLSEAYFDTCFSCIDRAVARLAELKAASGCLAPPGRAPS